MLLKWITCDVPEASRSAFAKAQEAWGGIAGEPEFRGQVGGWVPGKDGEAVAVVLGCWRDAGSHTRFLEQGSHDRIVEGSGQLELLSSYRTCLADQVLAMPGEAEDLPSALRLRPEELFLRLADCAVEEEQESVFLKTQEELWRPAMHAAAGMLGGSCASAGEGRYLVASLWRSAVHHAAYVAELLPELRTRTLDLGAMPAGLKGYALSLEPAWTIPHVDLSG